MKVLDITLLGQIREADIVEGRNLVKRGLQVIGFVGELFKLVFVVVQFGEWVVVVREWIKRREEWYDVGVRDTLAVLG